MVRTHSSRRNDTGSSDDYWWAPKRYGYGAGLPIAWQGWVVTLIYCVAITLSAWLILRAASSPSSPSPSRRPRP